MKFGLRKSTLCSVYIVLLLTTEFWHISVGGGSLRIYSFITPLVILVLLRHLPLIAQTGMFWALLLFLAGNVLSAAFAASPLYAFFSIGLLTANISIAFAVGLMVAGGHISPGVIVRITLGVTVASVIFGLLQVAAIHLGGVSLALSDSQTEQLQGGFASGFKTEANTFAKFLNVAFLLGLPIFLQRGKYKYKTLLVGVIAIGMLIALTRSALYGLALTLILIYLVQIFAARSRVISPRALGWLVLSVVMVTVFVSIVGSFNAYAAEKIRVFFNLQALLDGGSAATRIAAQGAVWDAFTESGKSLLLGAGWGQVHVIQAGILVHAGGGDFVNALGFGGMLGGVLYVLFQLVALASARRVVLGTDNDGLRLVARGVLYALLGLLITGQINGALIAPEYWMVFGLAMGLPIAARLQAKARTLELERNQ